MNLLEQAGEVQGGLGELLGASGERRGTRSMTAVAAGLCRSAPSCLCIESLEELDLLHGGRQARNLKAVEARVCRHAPHVPVADPLEELPNSMVPPQRYGAREARVREEIEGERVVVCAFISRCRIPCRADPPVMREEGQGQ